MPYDPGVTNRSGEIFASAISGTIDDLMKARKEREQMSKEDAYNDMVVQHAYQQGVDKFADPATRDEELNKYNSMSHSAKTGYAAGLAANIVSDWKQQSQTADIAQKQTQTALGQAQLNQSGPFAKDPMEGQTYYHPQTGEPIGTYGPTGQVQFYPKQAGESELGPVVTDPLKINDKEIPGIGVNRKTGQYVYFGESGLERDPKTGALGSRDTKGNFKALTAQQVSAMAMDPNNPVQQTAPGQPPPQGWWSKIFGGGGTPAQSPSPGGTPSVGTVIRGYKFKGGNPADPNSWENIQ